MWPRSLAARSIGAGDVSLTRSAARGIDAHDLARATAATLEAGIDVVDIAPEDDSERLVGDVLRALRLRDRALPITRVPALAATPATPGTTRDLLRERLPLRYLVDRIERTLRAIRLDALPVALVELHGSWRDSPTWPEFVDGCARLVRDGKVLAYGAYIDRIDDQAASLLEESWLVAMSIPYSLCERAAEPLITRALELRVKTDDAKPTDKPAAPPALDADPTLAAAAASDPNIAMLLATSMETGKPASLASPPSRNYSLVDPLLAANDPVVAAALARDPKLAAALGISLPRGAARDIAILARRPLAGAALAGTLGPGVKLRKDDDRALDRETLERIALGVAKLAALVKDTPPAARSSESAKAQLERNRRRDDVECQNLPELALRFAIDHGTIPLPRLHRPEHITDALAATIAPPLPKSSTENLDM
jgi:aryl-alcohol dehydrogenase-like predicted oxidoreductase